MALEADAEHAHTGCSESLAEIAHLVRGSSEAVDQQSAEARSGEEEFAGVGTRWERVVG
jgi:hypothetical protein